MDLKNWWTLSGTFGWRVKKGSIGCRRVMSEADLLCGMQTKAKCKKRVPSCSCNQLEFMQTSLNLTPTTKIKKNTVCLGHRVSIIFFKFLDSHGSESSNLLSLIKYDPVGVVCCKIHYNYLLPPMWEMNSEHVDNFSFIWFLNSWSTST